jgi:muramoyltetrapeptide carboxypeptidase
MYRKGFLKLLGAGGVGSFIAGIPSVKSSAEQLIKPKKLRKGDTIGLISPASRLPKKKQYGEIIEQVKKLGYEVKVGSNAKNRYGYLAGSDKQRAEDINTMFADESVDAIMPFRGGWGSNRILDLIDYGMIRENPKILVGFSDITSLLMAIYAKSGLVTFHGPVGKSEWTDYTTRNFRNTLGNQQSSSLGIPKSDLCNDCSDLYVITPGKANGKLLGGNLSVLAAMMGSDYLPNWENCILFLEDVGEDIYRIDRMLTQLQLNGVLDQISGFVFGQCTDCERSNPYSLTLEQVFDDHIKPLGIPAFSGAMFGHIDNMLTLPVGIKAQINAQKGVISLTERATSD